MLKHFLNPPNWFTSASIFCSVYAMSLLVGAEPSAQTIATACLLVVFGGIFDMLDGRVARITNRHSEFGVQLDSIADIISFGVAPGLIVYAWALHDLGLIGALIAFWFVLAAAFRLARFNVNTTNDDWPLEGHSEGLTSTMAGGLLVTFAWVSNDYLSAFLHPPVWVIAAVTVFLGLMMVSSLPWRSFRDVRHNRFARSLLAVFLLCCLAGAVVMHPSMWFGVGGVLYLIAGFVDAVITYAHFRRTGVFGPHADTSDEDDEMTHEAAV